jgi:hypothetical protein
MKPDHIVEMPLVAADCDLRQEIALWYCSVFNDPDTFGDSWTVKAAEDYLFGEAGKTEENLVLTYCNHTLAGVAVAVAAPIEMALTLREIPPEFRTQNVLDGVRRQVTWFVDETAKIMVFREVGVHKNFRGDISHAMELITRSTVWAVASGAKMGCFWTSRKSPLYRMLRAYDIRDLYDFGGDRDLVFMGDDPSHSLRRFRKPIKECRRLLVERLRHQRLFVKG